MLKRLSIVSVLSVAISATSFSNEHRDGRESLHFRDLHRDGSAIIIGHFGLPVGQTLTLTGTRAAPSKMSNASTLLVRSVNGKQFSNDNAEGSPPRIQISNVDELPMSPTIILEGYEFVVWRGSAEKNWHLDVEFMVTNIVEPNTLELSVLPP